MPIIFEKKLKRQQNLLLILLVLLLVGGGIFWWTRREKGEPEEIDTFEKQRFQKISIDFDIFQDDFLKNSKPLEKIPEFKGEVGRENPFLPTQ